MPWGGITFRHIVHLNVAARALSRSCSLLQHFVFRWMDSSISSSLSSMRLVLLWSASDGLLSTASPLFPFPCLLAILERFNFTLSYSISRHAYTFIVPLPQNSEPWLMKGERIRHSSYSFIPRVFFFSKRWMAPGEYELNISLTIMHYNDKHMVFASR